MRKPLRCAALQFALLGLYGVAAVAAQWVVAQDGTGSFRSIQGGISAASYGDVVYVSPGIYEERIALKDGVRVVGSGALDTVIRYAYGFEEVVRAHQMSSGSLEGVTVERLASVLPGPAVRVDSASLALVDCIVSGGQDAGIEVTEVTSTLSLQGTQIKANAGHGVLVHHGAQASLDNCTIEGNGGSGLLVGSDATARISGTTLASNGRCGLAVEGNARLEVSDSSIGSHPQWGVLALGDAHISLVDVELIENGVGGVRVAGTTDVTLTRVSVWRGGAGIEASGAVGLTATRLRLASVAGDGVALLETASLVADHVEVVAAGRHGIVLDTSGEASLSLSTIVECGEDGILVRSGHPDVRQTILAYNHGAGIRVDASQSPPAGAYLAYNAVWENASDYVGVLPSATDTAAPPQFVDPERGDLSLLPGSACLDAGPAWTTIGSGVDAASQSYASFEFLPQITDGWLGATWRSNIRLAAFPAGLETLTAECRWASEALRFDLGASLLGRWGRRATAHLEGAQRWPSQGTESGGIALAYGVDGALAGSQSWASAWFEAEVERAGFVASGRGSVAWPDHVWTADLTAGLRGPLDVEVSAGATGLSLRSLFALACAEADVAGGTMSLDGRITLLPTLEGMLEAEWGRDTLAWQARVAFQPASDAWALSASVRDAAVRVEGRARFVSGAAADGDLSVEWGGARARVRAGLALDSGGARVRAGLEVSLDSLLRRPANEPPVPAFRTAPPDPEAGKPVRFLADESSDGDGELREIWWDFGDGAAAEGREASHAYREAGTYEVTLTVSDDAGAVASLTTSVRIWPADTTPVAAFSAYPVSASGIRLPRPLRDGDLLRLDAGDSSDPDGLVAEYAWDIGADGSFDVVSAEAAATVGPLPAGAYPMTLRVLDDSGRSDAVMHVVVVDRSEAPQSRFSYTPPTPAVRDPVRFSDRSTDTDGAITSWEWSFGDGATSHEESPVHRYERVGRYDVVLRVTDDAGLSSSVTQPVEVLAVPEIADVGNVWAVLIGISDYSEVKDLQYAGADATAMARWLLDSAVEQSHIRLLVDHEGPESSLGGLVARRATLVNVREALGWVRRLALPDDLVLIHFSGHGFQGADDDGDEKDGVDEFFVLWDTVNAAKEDTALRDDEFGAAVDRIESQHVVIFFDGCYSGGLSRSLPSSARPVVGKQDLFSDFSVEGRLVFSASSESQDAFESDELQHGIFSYYVLEGLRGRADSTGDARVTAWELFEYVAQRVPERARVERSARQDPQLLGEGEVRVLLAAAAGAPVADFSYEPGVPFVGGAIRFADQSSGDRPLRSRRWLFGDGAASDETDPTYAYERPGQYAVELRVTDVSGGQADAKQVLTIRPAGAVVVADAASGRLVVSLGSENGVRVGDRFEILGAETSEEPQAELEVVELIERGMCACLLLRGEPPEVGVSVRLLAPG